MQLYVIRHAAAVERARHIADAARPLTDEGRKKWRRAVRGMRALGMRFDRLYHSPWLRAVESAEELVDLVEQETVVTKSLARAPAPSLLEELEGERVAVVGHQPWLGELVGLLVFGDPHAGSRLVLRKGGVVVLEGRARPRGMTIQAVVPPRILRAARPR